MGINWSRDRWRHVTPKGQTREIRLERYISKTAVDAILQQSRITRYPDVIVRQYGRLS